MCKGLVWATVLSAPLLTSGVACEKRVIRCEAASASTSVAENTGSPCCDTGQADCCKVDGPCTADRKSTAKTEPVDPKLQLVLKSDSLTCPAVNGIGCGHLLAPTLQELDKIDGVATSSANYTGTLIRVSMTAEANREKVEEAVRKVLTQNEAKAPVTLEGAEFDAALTKEQWRNRQRIGELSAIEFHTLALHTVRTFAKTEKLDKPTTDKLVLMVEQQWEKLAKQAEKDNATQPEDWLNRCKECVPVFLDEAKQILASDQLERFEKLLAIPCRGDNPPDAPPPPICSLSPAEMKERQNGLLTRVQAKIVETKALESGFAFRFQSDDATLTDLFEVIRAERECCAGLRFKLDVTPDSGPVWLEITGPEGTKELLQRALVSAKP